MNNPMYPPNEFNDKFGRTTESLCFFNNQYEFLGLDKHPTDSDLSYFPKGYYLWGGDGGDGSLYKVN